MSKTLTDEEAKTRAEELVARLKRIREHRKEIKTTDSIVELLLLGAADPEIQLMAGVMLLEAGPVMGAIHRDDKPLAQMIMKQALAHAATIQYFHDQEPKN